MAFENLKKICSKYLAGKCHIEVIDLTKNPSLAKKDQIIAIPTLIMKNYTGKRIVGDFSNLEKVLELFDLQSSTHMDGNNINFIEENAKEKRNKEPVY